MKKNANDRLTAVQMAVLNVLLDGDTAGQELREELAARGRKMSPPAFYQAMARIEEAGWAKGRYERFEKHGVEVRRRVYKLEGAGKEALRDGARLVGGDRLLAWIGGLV